MTIQKIKDGNISSGNENMKKDNYEQENLKKDNSEKETWRPTSRTLP